RSDGVPEFTCALIVPTEGDVPLCGGIGPNSEEPEEAGIQPFGLAVRQSTTARPGHVFASSFDGTFSVYRLDPGADTRLAAQTLVGAGAYGLAIHPTTSEAYITTKNSDRLFAVTVDDTGTDVAFQTRVVNIPNSTNGSDFGRGIAFNDSGTLAFIAYRTPASLLVMDTSVGTDGRAANIVIDNVPLATGPASVAVANSAPGGGELVYVTLFDSDEVAVIDPRRLEVVALIPTGDGPFDITIVQQAGVARAYVTLFEEGAIGVIDIDPTSVFYHQEIARIP
ncbi:MAG: YVTN family beta-propeller protein, partial [Myxococcota bacterium]